jgi:hypothetical protein
MRTQILPVRVETVKQIVLNWRSRYQSDVYQHKKQFKSAHQAASYYVYLSDSEYYDRYGVGPSAARQERLRRRLVPVFKNMLK